MLPQPVASCGGAILQARTRATATWGDTPVHFKRACLLAVLAFPVFLAPGPLLAETPEQIFESLFGKEAGRVAASADRKDDAAFAAKLLALVDTIQGQPDFKALLLQKAYEFGVRSAAGYPTAIRAMERLADLASDRKADCDQKALNVCHLAYQESKNREEKAKAGQAFLERLIALGDGSVQDGKFTEAGQFYQQAQGIATAIQSDRKAEVEAKAKWVTARLAVDKQVARCRGSLQANPQDKAAASQLLWLCLVELDNPAEAARYMDFGCDETTKKYVVVAGMKTENLPEAACLKLGDWYRGLADMAGPCGKEAMLRRSKTYCEQFLRVHADEDQDRMKAGLILAQVEKGLEGFAVAGRSAASGWIDLLRLVDPARDEVSGNWQVKDGTLVSDGTPFARLRLPYEPPEEYDFTIVFTRQDGNDAVTQILAKSGIHFSWQLGGAGNRKFGFSAVGGLSLSATENPTTVDASVDNGKTYTSLVQVRKDGVKAFVNGKLMSQHKTNYKDMGLTASWIVPDTRALGVGSQGSPTVFRSIQVLEVTGKGKVLRDLPKRSP